MARPAGPPSDSVLLVEGPDDKHVVQHVWRRHTQQDCHFCVIEKGGVEPLLDSIVPEILVAGRQAVGIMLDANTKPAGRWDEVKDRLAQVNINALRNLCTSGAIIEGHPRVGVWLMPNNTACGELENFVAEMIPAGDAVWPLSQAYIDGIPRAERKFSAKKRARAQVHAWLAAREDPRRMGEAIRTRDLAVDGALCRAFVDWLERLFA